MPSLPPPLDTSCAADLRRAVPFHISGRLLFDFASCTAQAVQGGSAVTDTASDLLVSPHTRSTQTFQRSRQNRKLCCMFPAPSWSRSLPATFRWVGREPSRKVCVALCIYCNRTFSLIHPFLPLQCSRHECHPIAATLSPPLKFCDLPPHQTIAIPHKYCIFEFGPAFVAVGFAAE